MTHTTGGILEYLTSSNVVNYGSPLDPKELYEFMKEIHKPSPNVDRCLWFNGYYWKITGGNLMVSNDCIQWRNPNEEEQKVIEQLVSKN
jgi:hypothetical protein